MQRRTVREFLLALIISLGAHALLIFYSTSHVVSSAAKLVQASDEIYRVPIHEIEPESARRPVLNRQEVESRAENAFQGIRDIVNPDMPKVPALVAEEVLSEREAGGGNVEGNGGGAYAGKLPGLGPNPEISGIAREGDVLDDLFSTATVDVFESAKRSAGERFVAEPVRIAGLGGGGGGKGPGWSIPTIDEPPPLEGNVPEPMEVRIRPVDIDKLSVPEPPPIDLTEADLSDVPPVQGDVLPPVPPLEEGDGQRDDGTKLDPYLSINVATYHDETGQGFFRIRVHANEKSKELAVLPKDIVFVLDASTSIGQKLYWFKQAIRECIKRLNPGDRFNVIGFKDQVRVFRSRLVPASPNEIESAIEFVMDLDASGRTDIYKSLVPIVGTSGEAERPFIVFLLSDGRPTTGIRDTRVIIQDLTLQNRRGGTIFALGAGEEKKINKYLLDMLSYLNRGFVRIETIREGIEYSVIDLYDVLDNPMLINIQGDYGAVDPNDVFPRRLPDLYREGTFEIYGKFTSQKDVYFRLEGIGPNGKRMDYVERSGFDKDTGTEEIAREWAFRRIYFLVGEMCLEGETPEKIDEIRGLSLKYGIQTPYE